MYPMATARVSLLPYSSYAADMFLRMRVQFINEIGNPPTRALAFSLQGLRDELYASGRFSGYFKGLVSIQLSSSICIYIQCVYKRLAALLK